jgi:zinc finger HIT domain-containing protein 1
VSSTVLVEIGSRNKTTTNVRRILQSQKTFKNYLDDEEAALAQSAQHHNNHHHTVPLSTVAHRSVASKATKPSSSTRSGTPASVAPNNSPSSSTAPKRTTKASRRSLPQAASPSQPSVPDPAPTPAPPPAEAIPETEEPAPLPIQQTLLKTDYDMDPLLKSYLPSAPSDRIMQRLLAEPPLTYHEARARPSTSGYPPRYFCTICGYWGKVKCRNCGTRICGLECYKVHEDSRCGAFF